MEPELRGWDMGVCCCSDKATAIYHNGKTLMKFVHLFLNSLVIDPNYNRFVA